MRNHILSFAVTGLLMAALIPAYAQEHERDGHDRFDRARTVIEQTLEDLHHIEHHEVWAVPERGHYTAAERNLNEVHHDLEQHRLDRRRLDAAIGEIEHISQLGLLDQHARERLNQDVRDLHHLRDDWHW